MVNNFPLSASNKILTLSLPQSFSTVPTLLIIGPFKIIKMSHNLIKWPLTINFSFFNPSNSINEFIKYVERYQNYIVYPTRGNGKKLFKSQFLEICMKYIDRITKVLYFGNPEFSNFKINKLTNVYLKFKRTKSHFYPIRIPVNEKIFLKESQLFIQQIILRNSLKIPSLLKCNSFIYRVFFIFFWHLHYFVECILGCI